MGTDARRAARDSPRIAIKGVRSRRTRRSGRKNRNEIAYALMRELRADLLSPDVVELIATFERFGVKYLLIGGHAVFFHGYPRLTADVDFAYDPSPGNVERLYAALREFWGGGVPAIESAAELGEVGMVFQFGRPPNRVDLLSATAGLSFDEAYSRRVVARVREGTVEIPVSVISLADLRATKAAAGRNKDLDDLMNLPFPEDD